MLIGKFMNTDISYYSDGKLSNEDHCLVILIFGIMNYRLRFPCKSPCIQLKLLIIAIELTNSDGKTEIAVNPQKVRIRNATVG